MRGWVAQIIGKVGANAKRQLAAPTELVVQLDGARNGEPVAEDQGLGQRVHAVGAVMLQQALAPGKGVAAVVACAIEQLAEIQVEVAQEGAHAVHVRQRNAQVAPVFLGPHFKTEHLAVAQARAQGLAGLQIFMGHGAQGRHAQLHGVQHIAGARKLPRPLRRAGAAVARTQAGHQHAQHFFMPGTGKAAAGAVVGNLQIAQAIGLQGGNLGVQPAAAFGEVGHLLRVAEVHLVDDGQHRNLEQDGVQPGPTDDDLDLARGLGGDGDVLFVETEQPQKIYKVALDEAQRAQVSQFGILKLQAA